MYNKRLQLKPFVFLYCMKEIKLKLFYVVTILVFFVINAHAFALFAKLLRPLAAIPYTAEPDIPGDIFLGIVVYTMIAAIADIFFLKQLGKETMRWFFIMMSTNTLCILLSIFISIIIHNSNGKPVDKALDLLHFGALAGLYAVKEGLFLFFCRKKAVAEN